HRGPGRHGRHRRSGAHGRRDAGARRAGPAEEPVIRYEEATKRYGPGTVALDGLSLEVPAGETCVLVGPSGGGKTTALKMVNRLVEPTSGRVLIDGRDVAARAPVALRRATSSARHQRRLFP